MHPSTQAILRWFAYQHLPEHLQPLSYQFHKLAHELAQSQCTGPELTASLRSLLVAKDAAVRAFIAGMPAEDPQASVLVATTT